jgi:hypothetical protein
MKTRTFILPAIFANPLINSDEEGLNALEHAALALFRAANRDLGYCLTCSEHIIFTRTHEMPELGLAECLEFTFAVQPTEESPCR